MKKFLLVIISVVSVLVLSSTIIYFAFTYSLSEKSINKSVRQNIFPNTNQDTENNTLEDVINSNSMDMSIISEISKSDTATNIMSDIVSSIYNYNLTSDDKYKYTEEDIISLVEDNIDTISEELDYDLSLEDKDKIIEYVRDNADYLVDVMYSINVGDYRS